MDNNVNQQSFLGKILANSQHSDVMPLDFNIIEVTAKIANKNTLPLGYVNKLWTFSLLLVKKLPQKCVPVHSIMTKTLDLREHLVKMCCKCHSH